MQEAQGGRVNKVGLYDGRELREMFTAATSWLEKSVPDINALNVFPVPDGDCGTNMLLTMRSTLEEAYRAPDSDVSGVAQAMAHGALMGARGNSGVILSQIFRGLAKGLEGKDAFSGGDFAAALSQGAALAYKALSHPSEGTILTVAKDTSLAAQAACSQTDDLIPVLEAAVKAARDSVANTPNLLPVLRQAGVVDAGGQGLYVLLDGVLHYLRGETEEMRYRRPQIVPSSVPLSPQLARQTEDEESYGYCVEFLVEGCKGLDQEKITNRLSGKGQCLIVVGDDNMVHIHIHTFEPGKVIQYATSLGVLHEIKIQNMDDQHKGFVEMTKAQLPPTDIATVAVVSGDGLGKVFRSLGVTVIVPGGQTMNPSTRELLEAVESVPQDKVIILPNNKNIVPVAKQVTELTAKKVRVVPTEAIPQGVAALLSLNYDAGLRDNASLMKEAISRVRTVEVTRAVRSTSINKFKIKQRQAIGFVDGELVSVGESPDEILLQALLNLDMKESEVITVYYGKDTRSSEAEGVVDKIRQQYPDLGVELVYGGQPHYYYIASVE